jgi:hypothetical protein
VQHVSCRSALARAGLKSGTKPIERPAAYRNLCIPWKGFGGGHVGRLAPRGSPRAGVRRAQIDDGVGSLG